MSIVLEVTWLVAAVCEFTVFDLFVSDCMAGDSEGRSALHMLAHGKSSSALSMTNLLIDKGDCHLGEYPLLYCDCCQAN